MNSLVSAFFVALKAHHVQKDKANKSYIFHPMTVSRLCSTKKAKIVALLHDVVEDSNITLVDLKHYGFDDDIVTAVGLLTKDKNVDYFSYLSKVEENKIAKEVKLADLRHNSNLTRLKTITVTDVNRCEEYVKAIKYLMDIGGTSATTL